MGQKNQKQFDENDFISESYLNLKQPRNQKQESIECCYAVTSELEIGRIEIGRTEIERSCNGTVKSGVANGADLYFKDGPESNPHKCVPFLETEFLSKTPTYVHTNEPRLLATHIPYTSLPQSILDSDCRVVYMCRNPKDVLVSWFHLAHKLSDKSRGQMTIDEMFEVYGKGLMPYGSYLDHVKEYCNVSSEHLTRFLFLTYEDMKIDTNNQVKRLAEFIGYTFTKEEEANGDVEEVVRLCSFEKLRMLISMDISVRVCLMKFILGNGKFEDGAIILLLKWHRFWMT
ncbi:hypothetical protein LXL04_036668 [Taraxacum kok-saghyz]